MHRLIMNSETYKMASAFSQPVDTDRDPTNVYLWRFPLRRLEAEAVRDVILSASGQINLNVVTFEQLREHNLSVTQATRLLAHRERLGGFQSVDDLNQVAGFPVELVADLKSRSTV